MKRYDLSSPVNCLKALWDNIFLVERLSLNPTPTTDTLILAIQLPLEQIISEYPSSNDEMFRSSRFYHNFDHLYDCLGHWVEQHPQLPTKYKNVIFCALCFHDIFYDPKANDNEERSAQWAVGSLTLIYTELRAYIDQNRTNNSNVAIIFDLLSWLTPQTITFISDIIMATKMHQIPQKFTAVPYGEEEIAAVSFTLDIDLSILGVNDPTRFNEYDDNIRKEYSHVPLSVFAQKRSEIMHNFLKRDNLYFTPLFQEKCDKIARKNLETITVAKYSPEWNEKVLDPTFVHIFSTERDAEIQSSLSSFLGYP